MPHYPVLKNNYERTHYYMHNHIRVLVYSNDEFDGNTCVFVWLHVTVIIFSVRMSSEKRGFRFLGAAVL